MRLCQSIALAAAAALACSAAQAVPSLQFVDNGDSSVTLQIGVTDQGSVATELDIFVSMVGLELTSADIVDPVFDTPNPGGNLPSGVTGILLSGLPQQVSVAYGSSVLAPGVYDFLRLGFEGAGTISATGLVAQLGVNNFGLFASIDVIPEPSSALICLAGFAALAIRRRG